jgi:hypothetical protein
MTFQFPKPFFGGLFVGADAFESESLAVRNTFGAMFWMTTLWGKVLMFICRCVVYVSWHNTALDNHTKTARTVQNLQRTTRLGLQETQKFERHLGEIWHLPSICLQWSVSKMWFETMYDVQKYPFASLLWLFKRLLICCLVSPMYWRPQIAHSRR